MSSAGSSQRFPLDDSAVRHLVACLALPATRPEPSNNNFNRSYRAFAVLAGLLVSLSPTATVWTESLTIQVIESSKAFILYYIREIVLGGKLTDFRHQFHNDVMKIVSALHTHPFAERGLPKSEAYLRALKIYLADVLPALLLTHDALDTARRPSYVFALFVLIRRQFDPQDDPVWHDPLYRNFSQILAQNPAMNNVLSSGFLIATNEFRVTLTSRQAVTLADHRESAACIYYAYQFIAPFIGPFCMNQDLLIQLVQDGLTSRTCELLSALAREVRDVARLDVADTEEKSELLRSSASILSMLGIYTGLFLTTGGRVRFEAVLQFDVLHEMKELDRILFELDSETEAAVRQRLRQGRFLDVVKPYLVYYDILERVSRRILHSECPRESPLWTTFARDIESLEDDRIAFDKVYRESCQAQDCPHSFTKSPLQTALHRSPTTLHQDLEKLALANSENRFTVSRCSRCRLVYYCSAKCQQSDWKAHKTVCASVKKERRKTEDLTNVLSRRDMTFMHTIACLTLSRHPPLLDGLVRDMDFTTFPPTVTFQRLDNPAYDEATIVIGEEEFREDAIRKELLIRMRSLRPEEVGMVYSRQFLPKGTEAVLTFVDWDMVLNEQGAKFKRRA